MRLKLLPTALVLVTASSLLVAQTAPSGTQTAPSSGGWRRVGNPPPQSAQQDPSTPVDRSDAYGQTAQAPAYPSQAPQAMPPEGAPPAGYSQPSYGQPSYAPSQNDRPAYGLPPQVTLQPGTYVTIRTNQPLSSDHNQQGDAFSGTLAQPVVVDGIVVAQRGQSVYGRVAEVDHQRSDKPSRLGLELTSLTLADGTQVPVRSQLVARQGGRTPGEVQAGTIATTTAVGAAIGAAADWGTGAAIGGGIGAAAGIIGVLATRNHATMVYPETPLTFRIEAPVAISTTRAPQAFRYVGPDEYDRPMAEPQLQHRMPAPGPYAYGPAPYAYSYPYPYYNPYYPYYYGPGFSIVLGRGPGYFWGRGYYRGWRR